MHIEADEPRPWGYDLTNAWALAEREGLPGGVSSVAGPPAHAEVLTLDDLRPSLLVPAHDNSRYELSAGAGALFLANAPDRAIETLTSSPFAASSVQSLSSWVGENDIAVTTNDEKGKPVVSIHSRGKLQRIDFDAEMPRLFGADAPLRPAELGLVRVAFGDLYFLGKRRGGTHLYSVRVGDDGVLAPPLELATVTTPEPGWQVDIAACNLPATSASWS